MNLIEKLRPRFRVHLRLMALEISGSPELEGFDEIESVETVITQLGGLMGYEGNWRDWSDQRQARVLTAVLDGLDDFDFREDDTEGDDGQ